MENAGWTIVGESDIATHLRSATSYVEPPGSTTIVTNAETVPEGAIATERAMLIENAGVIIPHLLGFRVVEEVARAVQAGDVGQVYGCYGSFRVPRGSEPHEVEIEALLPLLALVLEIIDGDISSAWARRASLLEEGDAWFVTLNVGPVIVTLEAMATADRPPHNSSELLIEVTGSDKVLRAEPMKQAVTIAPFDAPARAHGWWEDTGERFLHLVANLDERPMRGSAARLQAVWTAVQESASTGQPVSPA